MTRERVLFVDDEPRILDGVRRSLRAKRGEWDMSFVTSGQGALDLLAESPQDVVISDMRMPGMDGAELLTTISRKYPEVARVVLSGHTEPEAAIKVAMAGHRFLTKPSEPDHLIAVIQNLTTRTSAAHAAEARRIAGAVCALPALPHHHERLAEALRTPDVERLQLSRAVLYDVGLTAKLLQLSQSGFFGARASAASVDNVVNALGLPTIRALADAGNTLWSGAEWDPVVERHLDAAWRHAVATACLVGSVATPANRSYAQAAALLQDVGRFACLSSTGAPDVTADLSAGDYRGVPYLDVGVELLHLWGLPAPIVAAVAQRGVPHRPDPSGLGVATAVRTAHLLIQQTESRDASDGTHDEELAALLTHPQLAGDSAEWRAAADEASAQAGRWSPR